MKSLCSNCNIYTNHQVLAEYEFNYVVEGDDYWVKKTYQVIKCNGCDSIRFRYLYTDELIYSSHGQYMSDEDMCEQKVYEVSSFNILPYKSFEITPDKIISIYNETINAYNSESLLLCAGGIRSIIEGTCNENGIKKGPIIDKNGKTLMSCSLNGKIEGLKASGYITKDNVEILHNLRFLGNSALHELESPSKDELRLAISIIEQTLDNVFELQYKAKILKEKTAKRKK